VKRPGPGVAFVACFVVAAILYGGGAGSGAREIATYYEHHAGRQVGGFAVLLAGCILLLVFVVRAAAGDLLATASGIGTTLLLAIGNALWAATAFAVEIEHGYHPARRSHLLVEDAGWVVIVSGAALAIPFVIAVSRASRRRWFRALGAVTVPALATAYWYAPLALFLAWIVAAEVSGSAE
jgi:hypothetical protein